MKKNLISTYNRIIVDACYFSDKGDLPDAYSDKIEICASFIQGVTGYADINIIKRWLKKGDIDRNDGKGIGKRNYVALMQAWVRAECPMFRTKQDILHFSSYGRDVFRSWAYSSEFVDFCLKNNIEDGPLSPYWENISLTHSVIWDALNLPQALINDLEAVSESKQKRLTDVLTAADQKAKFLVAHVSWLLDFDISAIQIAVDLVDQKLTSWEDLYEELPKVKRRPNPDEQGKGLSLLMRFILEQLDAVSKNLFVAFGAFPFLKHYELDAFQALWNMDDSSAAKNVLSRLGQWHLVDSIGKERWTIREEIWRFVQREVEGLPKDQKRFLVNWDKRALRFSSLKEEYSKRLSSHHVGINDIADILKIRRARAKKGLYYAGRRSFFVRIFKQFVSLFQTTAYDSDTEYLEENSGYINSDKFLYSRFLLLYSDRTWVSTIVFILLGYTFVGFIPAMAGWFRLLGPIILVWGLLRFFRVEKAWQGWLQEILPLITNEEI